VRSEDSGKFLEVQTITKGIAIDLGVAKFLHVQVPDTALAKQGAELRLGKPLLATQGQIADIDDDLDTMRKQAR
jgi:hypothetical protein